MGTRRLSSGVRVRGQPGDWAGPMGWSRPCFRRISECERPRVAPVVHLPDISWPSIRSSRIQFLFICDEYQWAWTRQVLRSALASRTGEGTLSWDTEEENPPFGGRAARRALGLIALASRAGARSGATASNVFGSEANVLSHEAPFRQSVCARLRLVLDRPVAARSRHAE